MDFTGSLPVIADSAILLLGAGIAWLGYRLVRKKFTPETDPKSPPTFLNILSRRLPPIVFILSWALLVLFAGLWTPPWETAGL
ncbi:MAG TPA: hypothetical protein VLB09_05255, partial [Nitrospiria bacterium]|nr:hypothetical protein [Nitrospiria bacterium]